jgi:hypothetical protein
MVIFRTFSSDWRSAFWFWVVWCVVAGPDMASLTSTMVHTGIEMGAECVANSPPSPPAGQPVPPASLPLSLSGQLMLIVHAKMTYHLVWYETKTKLTPSCSISFLMCAVQSANNLLPCLMCVCSFWQSCEIIWSWLPLISHLVVWLVFALFMHADLNQKEIHVYGWMALGCFGFLFDSNFLKYLFCSVECSRRGSPSEHDPLRPRHIILQLWRRGLLWCQRLHINS